MDMSGKTAIVAGLGVSGQSMMEVLGSRAEKVLGVDEKKPDADLHSFDHIDWDHVDLVMTSPVFNPRTPFILEAQRRGIPVMSEVELAWQLRVDCDATGHPAQWIGITGTNGKTSTTEMTSEMLTACGLTAPAVGNIGKAVSHAAVDPANDVLCVELSSFQLHFTDSLELDCAAITNIADDHLDWHGGIDNYASDKAKVFHHAKKALVYNADDERVTKLAFAAETAEGCRRVGFTLSEPQDGQIGVKDGWIVDMSGIAGGEAGKPEQVAKVAEFTHLTEPDGTVYPHLLADALTALALVFLFAYSWEVLARTHIVLCETVINIIWMAFIVDYVVSILLAKDKKAWFKENLLMLVSIALPIFRPLRLLRLVAVLNVLNRTGGMAVRGRITLYTCCSVTLLMYIGALAELDVERGVPGASITDFGEAIWWSFVTVTTVGYGDLSPVTWQGRSIAIGLMITGVA